MLAKFSNILQQPEMAKKTLKLMVPFLNKQVGLLHSYGAGEIVEANAARSSVNRRAVLMAAMDDPLYIDDAFV